MNKIFTFFSTTLTVLISPPIKVVSCLGRSISRLSLALLDVYKKITSVAKNCFSTSPNQPIIPNNLNNFQEKESPLDKFKVSLIPDPLSENQINSVGEIFEKEIISEEKNRNPLTPEKVKNEEDEKVEKESEDKNFNNENIDVGHDLDISSQKNENKKEIKEEEEEIKDEKIPSEKKLDPNEEYQIIMQNLKNENRTEELLEKSFALYDKWLRKNPRVPSTLLTELRVFKNTLHREFTIQNFLAAQPEYNQNNFYWNTKYLQTSKLSLKTLENCFTKFNFYKIRQFSLSKLVFHYENKTPIPCLRIKRSVYYKQMVDHIALKKHQTEGQSEFFFQLAIRTSSNNINNFRSDLVTDEEIEIIYAQNNPVLSEREIELNESFSLFCQNFSEEIDDSINIHDTGIFSTDTFSTSSKMAYFKELEDETLTFAKPYWEIFTCHDSTFEQKEDALEKLVNLSQWLEQRKKVISEITQNKNSIAKLQVGQEYFENILVDTISFLENQGKHFLIISINKKNYTIPAHSKKQLSMHKLIRVTDMMRVDPSKIS